MADADADFRTETGLDWAEVARLVTTSRALDELEETRLVPEKKILYQFSCLTIVLINQDTLEKKSVPGNLLQAVVKYSICRC